MKKLLFWFLILSWLFVSVSFADFQSDLDVCNTKKNPQICQQQVRTKHMISKKKACPMKDGKYNLPLEAKRPNKNLINRWYNKIWRTIYYNIYIYDQDIESWQNFLFSYNCSDKEIINITELYNLNQDWWKELLYEDNHYAVYTDSCWVWECSPMVFLLEKKTKAKTNIFDVFWLHFVFNENDKEYLKLNESSKKYFTYAKESIKSYYDTNLKKKTNSERSDYYWWYFRLEKITNSKKWLSATLYFSYSWKEKIAKSKINLLTKTITIEK